MAIEMLPAELAVEMGLVIVLVVVVEKIEKVVIVVTVERVTCL